MLERNLKNILIIGHANIGDVCYDLAVVRPLRRHFPDAAIAFLTSSVPQSIVESYQGVDRVIVYDRRAAGKGFWKRCRLMATLRKGRFDLVVVLNHSLMYKYLGIPHQWSVRKYLGGPPIKKKMHIVDIYLEFLRSHGVEAPRAIWDFDLQQEKRFCDAFLAKNNITAEDKILGILPFSNWAEKDWPIDKWNRLAQVLRRYQGLKIVAFGKTRNTPEGEKKAAQILDPVISLVNKTTLRQAMALIRRCHLFVGADSSLLHLASCMGVETVGLYGATSKEYIYPYLHYHNIRVPSVALGCMPCYPGPHPGICAQRGEVPSPCMQGISVEDVAQVVQYKLDLGEGESRS
jgi:heptosyltransferase-2